MITNANKNPKLEGSNIIDCIPQKGYCPNRCKGCFYNNGFYLDVNEELPLVPSLEEVGDKIVRVNTGHDSNLQKELVLETTKQYKKKFYNTSLHNLDFPAPVILTCNPDENESWIKATDTSNLMAVRVRVNTWNSIPVAQDAIDYYTEKKVPILLTFMRYRSYEDIPRHAMKYYFFKKHIINSYWCLTEEGYNYILGHLPKSDLLHTCGKFYGNSSCGKCGNCEKLYLEKMK